jgi:hypothetical protein
MCRLLTTARDLPWAAALADGFPASARTSFVTYTSIIKVIQDISSDQTDEYSYQPCGGRIIYDTTREYRPVLPNSLRLLCDSSYAEDDAAPPRISRTYRWRVLLSNKHCYLGIADDTPHMTPSWRICFVNGIQPQNGEIQYSTLPTTAHMYVEGITT